MVTSSFEVPEQFVLNKCKNNQRAMIGIKSEYKDRNGQTIYSGQLLSKGGELQSEVYWNKDIGFRFRGQMLTQYILDHYEITQDISWFRKHLPKWI